MRILCIMVVRAYQFLSPFIHSFIELVGVKSECKFPESCSRYALRQLRSGQSVISSLRRIALRLLSCSPLSNWLIEGEKFSWMRGR